MVTDWRAIDKIESLRELTLPIWLTLTILPFVYFVGLWAGYDLAFVRINFETRDHAARGRAKLALVSTLHLRVHAIGAFSGSWPRRLTAATDFSEARAVMKEYRVTLRVRRRGEEAEG